MEALRIFPLLLLLVSLSVAANPGVQIRATKKGFAYANQVAQAEIAEQLKNINIPDQSGDGHHFNYWITNIRTTGLTPPTSEITLVPSQNGVNWALSNLGISMHCDWRVKYRKKLVKISTHGSADIGVRGVSLAETVGLGVDATGRPAISSKSCAANLGKLDIKFHGGTSFILNLFRDIFEHKLKRLLNDKICQVVANAVNVLANKNLQKMKMKVGFDRFLLDYSLVTSPLVTADFAELQHKGEIFWKDDPKECPFSPTPLPPLTDYSNMVNIWLTDYTANSFLYQAQSHGYLAYNVTKKDLSPGQEYYLNTTCILQCIGTIIPQVKIMYPNSNVELHIKSIGMPRAIFGTNNVSAHFQVAVEMWVHTPDDKRFNMVTLNMDVSLTVEAAIKNERVTGSIIDYDFKVSIVKSNIGPVSGTALNLVFKGVLNFAVVPELNKIGAKGMDLPVTDELQFLNVKLLLQKGFLLASTDVKYKGAEYKCQEETPTEHGKALYFKEESTLVEDANLA